VPGSSNWPAVSMLLDRSIICYHHNVQCISHTSFSSGCPRQLAHGMRRAKPSATRLAPFCRLRWARASAMHWTSPAGPDGFLCRRRCVCAGLQRHFRRVAKGRARQARPAGPRTLTIADVRTRRGLRCPNAWLRAASGVACRAVPNVWPRAKPGAACGAACSACWSTAPSAACSAAPGACLRRITLPFGTYNTCTATKN